MTRSAGILVSLCAVASLGALGAPANHGDINAIQCGSGPAFTSAISAEAQAGTYTNTVVVVDSNANSLYHNASGICSGSWQSINGVYTQTGSCDYVDIDGDHWFGVYTGDATGGDFKVHAGTGKYVGLEQTGHFTPLGPYFQVPNEFRSCVTFKGHWKFK